MRSCTLVVALVLLSAGGSSTASTGDAVHQEGSASWTRNSLVADLPNGAIYLYYFHQFDRPVVLNVADELAHQRAPGSLSVLFPDDVRQEAARRSARIQAKSNRCRWGGRAWIAGVNAVICFLLLLPAPLGGGLERLIANGFSMPSRGLWVVEISLVLASACLAALLIVAIVFSWWKKFCKPPLRIYYTLVVVAAAGYLVLLNHLRLITLPA